ncbi:hypothetical protein, partial [Streptomyces nigra]
ALDDAQKAFDAGQEALKKGDWEAYGKAQKDLQDALRRAEDAQDAANKGAGGSGDGDADADAKPSKSPEPTSSPTGT